MTSPSSNNEDKDAWLLKIELKREEPEEINKDEGIKKAMEVQAPLVKEEDILLYSATGTARNENRRYLRDTVVKTFGSIYNEFLPTKICDIQENGVLEAHEVPRSQGARPPGGGLLSRGSLVSLSDYFFLPKILK